MTGLLWILVKPSHVILYGMLVGLACYRRPWGRKLLIAACSVFCVSASLPVGDVILVSLEQRFLPPKLDRVDGILVLAGAELPAPSVRFGHPQLNQHADRLTTFLVLANRFPNARLAHSGGTNNAETDQSAVARQLILGAAIDPRRIVFENSSRNTCENASQSQQLLHPRPAEVWLLVTSAGHVPRAMACFRAVGWEILPFPTDFKGDTALWPLRATERLYVLDFGVHRTWLRVSRIAVSWLNWRGVVP